MDFSPIYFERRDPFALQTNYADESNRQTNESVLRQSEIRLKPPNGIKIHEGGSHSVLISLQINKEHVALMGCIIQALESAGCRH